MVIFREEDRKEIDRVFANFAEAVNRRRDVITELRKIVAKGDHFIRSSNKGIIRVEDGVFVDKRYRSEFIMEYLNLGDYLGDITELTYIMKRVGGMSGKIKDCMLDLKLIDNRVIIDTFMNSGDIGKTITAVTHNISKLNDKITRLRRLLFGR